ncbi:MAG: J domain-containing protein [Gallionellaceae bacterium]|jgi:hypothetical protein
MSLFSHSINISPSQAQPVLSKAQKSFNKLIEKIEAKRALLSAWENAIPSFQQKFTQELRPLAESSIHAQIQLLLALDFMSDQKGLTKKELNTLTILICDLADELSTLSDNETIKNIYHKHSGITEEEEQANLQDIKAMLEDILGFDPGDIDLDSTGALAKHLEAQFQSQQAQHIDHQKAQSEKKSKRKQTAKQLAKEEAQKIEEQQISQSIREVYRKLASALHPDRETDPQERERKTSLLQRVNQAYEKRNLLQLLELQLETEHIDQASIRNISEERLMRYNKILTDQLHELDDEIYYVESEFRMRFNMPPFAKLSPATLPYHLEAEMLSIKRSIREVEQNIFMLQDIKSTKIWLKNFQMRSKRKYY